ncbi:pre-rRNA processing protein [Blastomyces gilchristii SLH14081]|uniref:Pre-rRNA processing protein n=1 Tax=Blastomyces gilchristii (strain SLH14081) TaxID=559298 RepID=A0A179UER8_BLAGS|nr:pre-rRNA processing protein [Blastomyces gilchristii SLH14081]OAT05759.1 pre-rRNA processing protein [Blastomyces gilchristii SLH14081]
MAANPSTQQPLEKKQEQAGNIDPAAQFDLGITLILNSWPALNLAVQSAWGGPSSSDKRDWLCGAISQLFVDRPETDAEDIEDVLIQVMNDEFDVVVDDESAGDIGRRIMEIRTETQKGDFTGVTRMWDEWKAKGGAAGASAGTFTKVEVNGPEDEDEDEDDDESGVGDWADDVEMEDAQVPVAPSNNDTPNIETPRYEALKETKRGIDGQWERGKFLPEPLVDEDGFTKVVSKRRR